MAYRQVLLLAVAVAVAVACLAPLASAKQWVVGDEGGWSGMAALSIGRGGGTPRGMKKR